MTEELEVPVAELCDSGAAAVVVAVEVATSGIMAVLAPLVAVGAPIAVVEVVEVLMRKRYVSSNKE